MPFPAHQKVPLLSVIHEKHLVNISAHFDRILTILRFYRNQLGGH
jgi:hypothetical protein